MTPAARIQAAIEILDEIARGHRPADDVMRNWARTHRFAGSKDRRAISDHVYDVLRRRGHYAKVTGSESARAAMIAHVAATGGTGAVSAAFTGEGHAPAALSEDEAALASSPPIKVPPYDVPAFLLPQLREAFSDDVDAELAALDRPAPLDLRVNTLKGTRDEALESLAAAGIEAAPTPHSSIGIRIGGHQQITGTAAYKSGLVEPMDEGSQLAALAVEAAPGMQVADLCAGAGGKTLAIAAQMENTGQIYASDSDARRLGRLTPRMKRAGARNIQPVPWPQDGSFTDLEGKCDRVLLDVPCSGSGSWRRHPELKWRLTPEDLERLTKTQDALLRSAAPLVKPGGKLIYVTCSLLPMENEVRVGGLLDNDAAFALQGDSPRRLTPHRDGTDGFFIAVLGREPQP